MNNLLLLLGEMTVYFGLMLGLFRARSYIGIGGLFCALGVMHFVTVYLASSYFLLMPFGLGVSPGSLVLFAGFLSMTLLIYLREGLFAARQPVYGMLLGSFLLTIVAALLGFEHVRLPYNRPADTAFLNQMTALMLWGTLLLFAESMFIFRVFEWLMRTLGGRLWLSLWLSLAITCTFDQIFFFPALHFGFGVPWQVGLGGWVGKLLTTGFYAALLVLYLRYGEGVPVRTGRTALRGIDRGGRHDPATGAFHKARFDPIALDLANVAAATGRPLTLMLVEVDTKEAGLSGEAGDAVLRQIAQAMSEGLRSGDYVFRHDGTSFVVLAPGLPHHAAIQVASMMRQRIEAIGGEVPGFSIGISTAPMDGETATALLSVADQRVYAAGALGRDRVVGAFEA